MALTEEGIIEVPGLLSRWVRLSTGVKAHYVTSGESGPAVVLLHGGIVGSSGTAGWRFMAPFLGANGFRVYCPDMPAFGLTHDPDNVYGYGDAGHTDFIQDFANALCLDQFHIGGNSMGCMNSVNYLVAHPERILSAALIAGFIGDLVPIAEIMAKDTRPPEQRPSLQWDGTKEGMRRMMEAIIYKGGAISEDLVEMRTLAAARHQDAYNARNAEMFKRMMDPNHAARSRTKGRLETMTLPMIYLYGKQDVLFPHDPSGYMQEDALPNVQFFYPDETGHQGQTDQPELFNLVFLEFFRDGRVSWDTAQRAGMSDRRPPNPERVAVPENAPAES